VREGGGRETKGERGKETERARNITWGWGGAAGGDGRRWSPDLSGDDWAAAAISRSERARER